MATSNKWNTAATNGLLLSLITIIASLLQSVFKIEGLFSMVLWAAKFGGCIYLLHYFMKQHSLQEQNVSYGESFKYGFLICCFSSIVCLLNWIKWITADHESLSSGLCSASQPFRTVTILHRRYRYHSRPPRPLRK